MRRRLVLGAALVLGLAVLLKLGWSGFGAPQSSVASSPPPFLQAAFSPSPPPSTTAPLPTSAVALDLPAVPERYRGQIIRQRVRRFPKKLLALTFDDGPSPNLTPQVLRILRENQAHATFFVLGKCVKRWPGLVKQAAEEGHAIGSHSYRHPSSTSPTQAAEELTSTAQLIEQATGHRPVLFRPPYGITVGNLCRTALAEKYTAVLWTISSADSNPIAAAVIARNIIHTPNPGDIVLMHDGATHVETVKALPQVLRELGAAGFEFVTLPRLLQEWDLWLKQEKSQAQVNSPRENAARR